MYVLCTVCPCQLYLLQEFLDGSPHLSEFESEMKTYSDLEEEIQELAELKQVGPILFSTG